MTETKKYNPDVLTCLANLSNDEVFTPPQLANRVLDLLPTSIWGNKDIKFLDPVSKSGVFLREIAKRLMKGLEKTIPDIQERANHIYKNQLFGIAITELTALLSRRTIYCSKVANGRYSVCGSFTQPEGNIRYNRVNHKWVNDKCDFCGAKEGVYDRGEELETHAYEFIHTNEPKEIFNMKFDVIVGNPPYQLNDGGGTGSSASPIYHNFITQAKKMNPKYLTMIIPSRWFSGGKGLDDFRDEMLNDSRISNLVDYSDSNECFPGVDIAGGICYFLWDREHHGECSVENIHNGKSTISKRRLNEFSSTFVRDSVAISIIKKIKAKSDTFLDEIVSSRRPFGLDSKERPLKKGDLTLIWSGGEGPYDQTKVKTGINLIKKWKVLISKASHDHGGQSGKDGTRRILSRIEVIPPDTVCTESYLIIGPYNTKREAVNMANYLRLKFSRFLISTILLTQNITKDKFQFVPHVDLSDCLTDSKLYKMYELTNEEISYIESMIRPMELEGNE